MANKPRRMCTTPGCPNFAVRFGVCAQCATQREQQRGSAASRGYDNRWRKARAAFLREHPVCLRCGAIATDVDHIVPRALGGSDEWWNLQAWCHACHSRKTAEQTPR